MNDTDDRSALAIALKAHEIASKAEQKIDSHESICEERYLGIQHGMARLEKDIEDSTRRTEEGLQTLANRMWVASGSVIGVLITIIAILWKSQ